MCRRVRHAGPRRRPHHRHTDRIDRVQPLGRRPIVQPTWTRSIITPIAPFTLTNRPIVIPGHSTVRVQPTMDARDEIVFTLDGQSTFPVHAGDEISVARAPKPLRLIHPTTRSYFEVLRTKLKWGER